MMPEIMNVMRIAAQNGEPALRPLEYNYPNQGYGNVKDQFMLGNNILVAPVITEKNERTIVLPPGKWLYKNKTWKGGRTYSLRLDLKDLPVFIRAGQNGLKDYW